MTRKMIVFLGKSVTKTPVSISGKFKFAMWIFLQAKYCRAVITALQYLACKKIHIANLNFPLIETGVLVTLFPKKTIIFLVITYCVFLPSICKLPYFERV